MTRHQINQNAPSSSVQREELEADGDQCRRLLPLTRRVTLDDEAENALPAVPTIMGRNHIATSRKRGLVSPLRPKPEHRRSSAISLSILAAFNALEIETDDPGDKRQQWGPSASFSEHRDDDKRVRVSEIVECNSSRSILEHRGKRLRSCSLIEE